jgi:TIR domain
MLWEIRSFPRCSHHCFLSHSAEDRATLVGPVRERLLQRETIGWFDQIDYNYGRSSREAIRNGILLSRHTVFFITDAMLNSPRGWCVMELTLAEMLQNNMTYRGGVLANVILPLFFVEMSDSRLPRSVWQSLRDSGRFCEQRNTSEKIDWATQEIQRFLSSETSIAAIWARSTRQDESLSSYMKGVSGLRDRVTRFQPHGVYDT